MGGGGRGGRLAAQIGIALGAGPRALQYAGSCGPPVARAGGAYLALLRLFVVPCGQTSPAAGAGVDGVSFPGHAGAETGPTDCPPDNGDAGGPATLSSPERRGGGGAKRTIDQPFPSA